ncbi:hypothetical protein CJ030_MR2G019393 [Morella rubra]|uniref:Uncharacterized protein n=1 Tax=Morella rubra TaxID=262757 RepID=A0A6A1WKY7_9ROSI|nr:hypothetical protein CJ030_MR2G019393 [Morella rubra]
MVKRKQPAGSSSKPTKVPHKSKPRPFDASRFMDARASELFHSTFHNRKVLLNVRVPEPVYPYVESSREPPSFEAMSLILFGHLYPYAGGTLYTSDFSAKNHVVSRIALTNLYPVAHLSSISLTRRLYRAHSIAFPPDGPFPDTLSAIGATTLSLSRAHLKRRRATASTFVPPDDPSSSVPPSIPSSSAGPSHSTLPTPLDPSIAASFSLIMDQLAILITQSINLIKIVMRHQRQLKCHTLTLARHARATECNTRAVSRLHRLIRPLVGADAL